MALGKRLAAQRRRLGMSQEQLATLLACSKSLIAWYETGRAVPPQAKRASLARHLRMSVHRLFPPAELAAALAIKPTRGTKRARSAAPAVGRASAARSPGKPPSSAAAPRPATPRPATPRPATPQPATPQPAAPVQVAPATAAQFEARLIHSFRALRRRDDKLLALDLIDDLVQQRHRQTSR